MTRAALNLCEKLRDGLERVYCCAGPTLRELDCIGTIKGPGFEDYWRVGEIGCHLIEVDLAGVFTAGHPHEKIGSAESERCSLPKVVPCLGWHGNPLSSHCYTESN